jgi:methionyl-tRNA formyltransferase
MKEAGAGLLIKTIKGLENGSLEEMPQSTITPDPSAIKHAPKLFTETCIIDWHKPASEIYNLIRGLSPFPGALTQLNGKVLKIYKSEKKAITPDMEPGGMKTDGKTFLKFACADGYIGVKELQLEGKKRMPIPDFLRGYKITDDK